MRRARGAVALLICAAAARPVHASPLELFGFGGRSPAMAGAGVASTEGYDAVFLNPGGLGLVKQKRATVGGLVGDFALELDGAETSTENAGGLVIGGAVPMPLGGVARDRVGLGFGFHIPTVAINRARAPFPGEPTFSLLESRSHVIGLMFAVGVRVRERLSVGFGVNALAVLRGGIAVTTDGSGRFTTQSEQRLLTRFAPIAGVRWAWRENIDIGVVARAPSRSDYDIAVTSDLSDVLPLDLPLIRIAGAAQYDPLTVAAEAAFEVRSGLTISAHLAWAHWSGYPLPTQNAVAGNPPQEPPGFHDTVIPRVAVEYVRPALGGQVTARGGLALVPSPAPEQSGRASLLDNDRAIAAGGLGLGWPGRTVPLHLDAWVQFHAMNPRTHVKDTSMEAIETGGHIVVGGLTVGVDL
jgi:long-subunit fatty acid transport protein